MAIRKRFENTVAVTEADYAEAFVDTVDPSKNAFEGSSFEKMGLDEDNARSYLKRMAYNTKPPLPSQMHTQDLLALARMNDNEGDSIEKTYRGRIRSPLTGIRAMCVSCKGGYRRGVAECAKMDCPLWAFRLGQNGFYGRR